jgi:hypothetical protein
MTSCTVKTILSRSSFRKTNNQSNHKHVIHLAGSYKIPLRIFQTTRRHMSQTAVDTVTAMIIQNFIDPDIFLPPAIQKINTRARQFYRILLFAI